VKLPKASETEVKEFAREIEKQVDLLIKEYNENQNRQWAEFMKDAANY
jgi:hypothetical protein